MLTGEFSDSIQQYAQVRRWNWLRPVQPFRIRFVQKMQEVRLGCVRAAFLYAFDPEQFVEVLMERGGPVLAATGSYLLTHAL